MRGRTIIGIKLAIVIVLYQTTSVYAQKLPNKQQLSLRTPVNLKIDGYATEWNNKSQAYNTTDDIFYTVANDDENLYLVVRAPIRYAVDKTLLGGITLSIAPTGHEKAADNIAVTFPTLGKENRIAITAVTLAYQDIKDDTVKNTKQHDSLITLANHKAVNTFKMVKVKGIRPTDTLLSVYNTEGIKVAAQFNRNMELVCEFAIPLKYGGVTNSAGTKLSYNIKLNGPLPVKMYDEFGHETTGVSQSVYVPGNGVVSPEALYRSLPTDFWGEYTLAKK